MRLVIALVGVHMDTHSAEVTVFQFYAGASTRLTARAITRVTRAFDLASSAAPALLHAQVSRNTSLNSQLGTYGNSYATPGLTAGSERLISLLY